jgi:predicted RNase H-like HicB family nuclease
MGYNVEMNSKYTAILKEDSGWWIGWIEEVPGVNCQERTRKALILSLQETLREALADNRSDAIDAAGENFEELEIAV